jgi:uncharacterized protein YjcR
MTGIEKEIVHQMRLEGNSHSQIASSLGISINTIKSYCRRNNLLVGGVDYVPAETTAHCEQCGKRLVQDPKRNAQKDAHSLQLLKIRLN